MNEFRPFIRVVSQGIQHAVKVALRPASSLDRQARWLINGDNIVVNIEDTVPQELDIRFFDRGKDGSCRLRLCLNRRHSNFLTRIQPQPGFRPLTADPDLSGSKQFLKPRSGQAREMLEKPPI